MNVKFLRKEEIEAASRRLLMAYHQQFGPEGYLPIPVEEILESHLGLTLDFDDLRRRLGMADVLGATWVHDRLVVIDQSLDPTVDPRKEGRYRFTIAHELGHWELHRHHYEGVPSPGFHQHQAVPSIVCRTSSRKDPMEWQADSFASYLLMPGKMVTDLWSSVYGTLEPYVATDELAELAARRDPRDGGQPVVTLAREMAREFLVSGQAMQIRLMEMGLIRMAKA